MSVEVEDEGGEAGATMVPPLKRLKPLHVRSDEAPKTPSSAPSTPVELLTQESPWKNEESRSQPGMSKWQIH